MIALYNVFILTLRSYFPELFIKPRTKPVPCIFYTPKRSFANLPDFRNYSPQLEAALLLPSAIDNKNE